jgi:PRTRC genetic system protein E
MFFNDLSQMMTAGTVVNLTVHCQNGNLTVSVFPNVKGLKDDAQNHLQPIVLTGTAEELDNGFFNAVREPVLKATGLLADMKRFETSLTRVESERKEAREQKQNSDKKSQERKAKFDKLISRADEQEKDEKFDAALQSLREARTMADGENVEKTDARINQLRAKCMQTSLF